MDIDASSKHTFVQTRTKAIQICGSCSFGRSTGAAPGRRGVNKLLQAQLHLPHAAQPGAKQIVMVRYGIQQYMYTYMYSSSTCTHTYILVDTIVAHWSRVAFKLSYSIWTLLNASELTVSILEN